jgi:hypothetical protein
VKTVHIPGGRKGPDIDECVDFGQALYLDFTAKGVFATDHHRSQFIPPLPDKITVNIQKLGPFEAPHHNFVVHCTFDQLPTGRQIKIDISVKRDPNCKDP